MAPLSPLPGFIAGVGGTAPSWSSAGDPAPQRTHAGDVDVWHWGVTGDAAPTALVLSRVVRETIGTVPEPRIAELLSSDPSSLQWLLPPFAAVSIEDRGVVAVADSMGFRPIHHTTPGDPGRGAVSTSSLLLGRAVGARFDERAVAVQSLLGWQLGQRTLFEGVTKLAPGALVTLSGAGVSLAAATAAREIEEISLDEAVARAAAVLRSSLESILDDHPDAVLQLTGGQDSRLLLSAIPPKRRRGLKAMTLDIPGGGDAVVAADIAARYGLSHDLRGLGGLDHLTPETAWARCVDAARAVDGTADPVALAAIALAEEAFDPTTRISGLGGEIARGFYYLGRVRSRTYSRSDSDQLARWRMFVNDAVEPDALEPEFQEWSRNAAADEVYTALRAGGDEWFRATDELYLRHRMQRWAGVTDVAMGNRHLILNPMLDSGFLHLAACLTPEQKADSLFLSRLQMELDPHLGAIRLEGRPAPRTYAYPTALTGISHAASKGRRLARKAAQRLRGSNRAPAGGEVLARLVVEHWRSNPGIVAGLGRTSFIRDGWVEGMLDGRIDPRASTVALVTNLLVAMPTEQAAG